MNFQPHTDRRERPHVGFTNETERCRAMFCNRDLYLRQSAMTKGGRVPPIAEVLAVFDQIHNGAVRPKGFSDAN